jgi:hypothetical protein
MTACSGHRLRRNNPCQRIFFEQILLPIDLTTFNYLRINLLARLFAPVIACFILSGCLTSEFKEIRLSINPNGSGKGSITYIDISSEQGDDTVSLAKEDFNSLIADYVEGKSFETANPGLRNIKKRLFVQGNKLMGEVSFEFDSISEVGLYRHGNQGPYMYYTLVDGFLTSGQYTASNGSYGGDKMPIVFWPANATEFYLKMALSTKESPKSSLASNYEAWQKRH